jgi:hypothetical protein
MLEPNLAAGAKATAMARMAKRTRNLNMMILRDFKMCKVVRDRVRRGLAAQRGVAATRRLHAAHDFSARGCA